MQGKDYSQVFASFSSLKVMVVGDVMVDSYLFGKVDRISPEAPVPIVSVQKRLNRLGGAANVALNVKALGAEPVLCSVIGTDPRGADFLQLLKDAGISPDFICRSIDRSTTTKFRVIGNNAQMLRVDEENTHDLCEEDEKSLLQVIFNALDRRNIHAVIIQDYDKGVLTAGLIAQLIIKAGQLGIPVVVDPKRKNFRLYKNVTLFKPNLKELREGLNLEINANKDGDLVAASERLHHQQAVEMVMITLSEAGVFISSMEDAGNVSRYRVPAHIRSIADVSGAGDTVVSVAAVCLAAGLPPVEIAAVSNLAGGLVCEEVGVVPVSKERLLAEANRLGGLPGRL
jgi:rfaE bifunctional protein kinase chain/domain